MKAPEKLYLHPTAKGEVGAIWLTFSLTNEDVEYIRKDAFIEKTSTWFANRYQVNGYLDADDIEDFKNYMKGESYDR